MKYLLFIPLAMFFLVSCESTAQKTEDSKVEETKVEETKPAFVDLNIDQFKKMMNEPNVVILDVRTPQETAEGKIEGAIEIDVLDASFDEKIKALDKDKTYLVYCRSGKRSVKSCNAMADQGFNNLYNLLGGYNAWSAQD
jgi:rhodanese-related sulfurtransferase